MKTLIVSIGLALLVGCASGPQTILVKKCQSLGADLFSCELISKKEIGGK